MPVKGKGQEGQVCDNSGEYITPTGENKHDELVEYLSHMKAFRQFIVILKRASIASAS